MTARYRLSRAGVLNVWQYDEQVFEFADGRLLLRGANGAGKSKTLEMLLPFVLDGDRQRMTASGRHHTSLLWLMLDGYSGQNRAGYLWVEFARTRPDGRVETMTCGVGVRASQAARTATPWYFTFPGRVGQDLPLEDGSGPLTRDGLRAAVEPDGHFFESPRAYKQHVGRLLFGLEPPQYDELLRLLYWLRQPQVGEDIEPAKLAEQLVQALPQLDDEALRAAGDTFDELAAFGEQLDRQRRSAEAVAAFAEVYAGYARAVLRGRGEAVVEAHRERGKRAREVERLAAEVDELTARREAAEAAGAELAGERAAAAARLRELEADPALRTQRELVNRRELAAALAGTATTAQSAARAARARAERSGERMRGDAARLCADLGAQARATQGLTGELGRAGVAAPLPVPPALHDPALQAAVDAEPADDALARNAAAARAARTAVGELLAAVQVVDAAREELVTAGTARAEAERAAAAAEQRAEEERGRLADAARAAESAEGAYSARLDAWRGDDRAVAFAAPAELTAETLPAVARSARAAAEPELARHRTAEAGAAAERAAATTELASARRRRAEVEAERDPAPAAPAWARDPRADADGAPLWRLVDFAPGLDAAAAAGLEAALESAGLLDALVRPDGAVLGSRRRDVVLPAGPPAGDGPSLVEVLVADPPQDAGVRPEVVRGVLARVAWRPGGAADGAGPAAVGGDGTWRLGPLVGRAGKAAAQYIGATARAAERARRLAELDTLIAALAERRDVAAAAERAARAAREALESWLSEAPRFEAVLAAWARLDERGAAAERAERRAEAAEAEAVDARSAEARLRTALAELGAAHRLPTDAAALTARREQLRTVDAALARHADACEPLRDRLRRWAEDAERALAEAAEAEAADGAAVESRERAEAATAAADELERAVGASLREIRDRIDATSRSLTDLTRRAKECEQQVRELLGDIGRAEQARADAGGRLAEQEPVLAAAVAALAAVAEPPGLLDSGLGGAPVAPAVGSSPAAGPCAADETVRGVELARSFAPEDRLPAPVLALARRFGELAPPSRGGTETAVYAAWQDAASGPGGDCAPRVVEVAGALSVIGRDESGEHPIGELAGRLATAVARDAELLTDRERRLFEEHILGDLGESLRARRLESDELVTEMNQLLGGVETSQGIRVQLRWALRDDVAADARRAVELLGSPVGALLPDERRELRDALHRLIDASRADAPEDSYTEHLARALDYRRWFAFRIRYTRPESAGSWLDLHRRSPLSQGEQKVVCYLPLFAAAAAHFSSLAGAAPHSPRFVLLDDAFPKIDVRTHPLLFGLLVQLDLDFVVTSERLWGDHATVPSLAIYEALRDPNERGIAQYRHHWDGQRLAAVPA